MPQFISKKKDNFIKNLSSPSNFYFIKRLNQTNNLIEKKCLNKLLHNFSSTLKTTFNKQNSKLLVAQLRFDPMPFCYLSLNQKFL